MRSKKRKLEELDDENPKRATINIKKSEFTPTEEQSKNDAEH